MKIIKTHWMTRREWVDKHYTGICGLTGGLPGCPSSYGFSDAETCGAARNVSNRRMCDHCFDRPAKVDGKYILVRGENQ